MGLSKQQQEVKRFAEAKINSLPRLNTRTSSRQPLNQQQHPDFVYPLPNPTLAHDKAVDISKLDPECFELLGSKLVLFGPDIYWFGLVTVRCPLCNKPANPHGWCKQIRMVFALHNTYFLAGRRYKCVDCQGLKAGKTFTPNLVGQEYVDMPDNVEDDGLEAAQESGQQQTTKVSSAQVSKQQQQRQQARQGTLQRKTDKGQSLLTFMAYDRAVLAQLPEFVQQQVPFITTAKGAVDVQLLELIKLLAVSNVGFASITKRLQEQTHTQYYQRQLVYYSYAKEAEAAAVSARGGRTQRTIGSFTGHGPLEPPAYVSKDSLYTISAPYVVDLFLSSTELSREYMALWLAGIGGEIVKLDHSFKASKRIRDSTGQQQFAAALTFMNEFCQIHCTMPTESKSLLEVKQALAVFMSNQQKLAVDPSDAAAVCGPTVAYVDDAEAMAAQLMQLIPSLQHVLADVLHVMKRVYETLTARHAKAAVFMRQLSGAIFKRVTQDEAAVRQFHTSGSKQAMGKDALDKKGPQYWASVTRRYILPPDDLKAALDRLWREFSGTEGLDPTTGEHLFTPLTTDVLAAIKDLIDRGHFCDPFPVEKMYIVSEREGHMTRYICKRGTSQLEGYHKHLADLLVGTNYSALLAGALITIRNYRWSVDAGVRNRQDPDFVTKDLWLLDDIQHVCQKAGFGNPLPNYNSQYQTAKQLGLQALPTYWADWYEGDDQPQQANEQQQEQQGERSNAGGHASSSNRQQGVPEVEPELPPDAFWNPFAPGELEQMTERCRARRQRESQQQQQQQEERRASFDYSEASWLIREAELQSQLTKLKQQVLDREQTNAALQQANEEMTAELAALRRQLGETLLKLSASTRGSSAKASMPGSGLSHPSPAAATVNDGTSNVQQGQHFGASTQQQQQPPQQQDKQNEQQQQQQPAGVVAGGRKRRLPQSMQGGVNGQRARKTPATTVVRRSAAAAAAGGASSQPPPAGTGDVEFDQLNHMMDDLLAGGIDENPSSAPAEPQQAQVPPVGSAAAERPNTSSAQQQLQQQQQQVSGRQRINFSQHVNKSVKRFSHARRVTLADLTPGISTDEERALWQQLYFMHTKESTTKWKAFLAEWNQIADRHARAGSHAIKHKTLYKLQRYQHQLVQQTVSHTPTSVGMSMQATHQPQTTAPQSDTTTGQQQGHQQQPPAGMYTAGLGTIGTTWAGPFDASWCQQQFMSQPFAQGYMPVAGPFGFYTQHHMESNTAAMDGFANQGMTFGFGSYDPTAAAAAAAATKRGNRGAGRPAAATATASRSHKPHRCSKCWNELAGNKSQHKNGKLDWGKNLRCAINCAACQQPMSTHSVPCPDPTA